MASRKASGLSSQPQVTSVAWGWRLEVGLALLGFGALKLSSRFGSGGPVLLSGLLIICLANAPALRASISSRLASWRQHSGTSRSWGSGERLPRSSARS